MDDSSFIKAFLWGVGLCALVGFTVYSCQTSREEQREWQRFRSDHHCVLKGHIEATSNGRYTNPAQECWDCDDGQFYCRTARADIP